MLLLLFFLNAYYYYYKSIKLYYILYNIPILRLVHASKTPIIKRILSSVGTNSNYTYPSEKIANSSTSNLTQYAYYPSEKVESNLVINYPYHTKYHNIDHITSYYQYRNYFWARNCCWARNCSRNYCWNTIISQYMPGVCKNS